MRDTCTDKVTHIGHKGYIYCASHGQFRQVLGAERTREMYKYEVELIKAGKTISYKRMPQPRPREEQYHGL